MMAPQFWPTKPPATPAPVTAPPAASVHNEAAMALYPAKPPAIADEPPLTAPVDVELAIEPPL